MANTQHAKNRDVQHTRKPGKTIPSAGERQPIIFADFEKTGFFLKVKEFPRADLEIMAAGFVQVIHAMRHGHLVGVRLSEYDYCKSIQAYINMANEEVGSHD